ncbi:hypothetical protein PHJA_002035700 [Phtheirospermum japonicum]|uniref:Uncharacterized protein n=1 Tax=Phtheirospermum japonicum TaxID=374723 RepID=A0A830CNE9_9LAMI|nr:hypothetical protein PHJA_002035700 [Phtheirospermum japonicum]
MRNKGKVHPLTSDAFSVLKLLPAAILTLISLLSHEEREVLAYMISRSLKSTNPSSCCYGHRQKSPALFDCDCFHCYTSFWFRWDSSSNRELIHQAIEAFEDHLNKGEQCRKTKRKDKVGRRKMRSGGGAVQLPAVESPGIQESLVVVVPGSEVPVAAAPVEVVRSHKGLARKVLPDVMGIFNSRLWSLWSPNV